MIGTYPGQNSATSNTNGNECRLIDIWVNDWILNSQRDNKNALLQVQSEPTINTTSSMPSMVLIDSQTDDSQPSQVSTDLIERETVLERASSWTQKPTARQFYFKISEKCPQFETTNWVSMKNKLENCKIHYRRTRNLLGKEGKTTDTEYLERLCPFYGLLDKIFCGNLKPTVMNFFAKPVVTNKGSEGGFHKPEVVTGNHKNQTMGSTAQSSPSRFVNPSPSPLFAGRSLSLSMPDLHTPGTDFKKPNLEPAFELTQSTIGCLIKLILKETENHPDTLELAEEAFYKNISANCPRLKKADWMILKSKVESLKNSYIKARLRRKEYENVTSTDENQKAITEPADPTCPCYDILDKIFGPGLENSDAITHPTANDITNEQELKKTNPLYNEMSDKSNKEICLGPSDCEQAANKALSMPNISIVIKSPNKAAQPLPSTEKSTGVLMHKTFSTNSIFKKGATVETPQTISSGDTEPRERISADAALQNASDEIVSDKSTISEHVNQVYRYELADSTLDSKKRNVNIPDKPVANNEPSQVSKNDGPLTQNHQPAKISVKAFSMPNMPIIKGKSYNSAAVFPSLTPAAQKMYKKIMSNFPELRKAKWVAIESQMENFQNMWKRQAGAGMISDNVTREAGYRNQVCPLYHIFDKIYGSESEEKVINVVKFRNRSTTSNNSSEDELRRAEYSSNEEFNESPLSPDDSDTATCRVFSMPNMHILRKGSGEQTQIHSESSFGLTDNSLSHRESEVSSTATSPKPHSSLAQVIDKNIYIRSLAYETKKLEVEHEKLRLEQKKFEWQQEREGTELKIKQKEIDHDFELKKFELNKLERMEKAKMKLQLDHEERIKKYEIKMKLQNFGGL
ncbi:hypothetical protein GQX74_014759 [Glossina fuscipes]|nr:hypothetical protein GQX74_014759 [Glossina fuscipes]